MMSILARFEAGATETLTLQDECTVAQLKEVLWSLCGILPTDMQIRQAVSRQLLTMEDARLLDQGVGQRETVFVESSSRNATASSRAGLSANPTPPTSFHSASLPKLQSELVPISAAAPASSSKTVRKPSCSSGSSASIKSRETSQGIVAGAATVLPSRPIGPAAPSTSRAAILDIIHELKPSLKLQSLDPNVPRGSNGIHKLGKANKAIWKHQRDMKMNSVVPGKKKKKGGRNAIQDLYGSSIMREVEEIEKKRFFDALEKREISDDPILTDLDTMEEELNCQQLLGQWDPVLFDFLVRAE